MKKYASLFLLVSVLALNAGFAQSDEVTSVEGKKDKEAVSTAGDEQAEESSTPSLQHDDQSGGCGCSGKGKKN